MESLLGHGVGGEQNAQEGGARSRIDIDRSRDDLPYGSIPHSEGSALAREGLAGGVEEAGRNLLPGIQGRGRLAADRSHHGATGIRYGESRFQGVRVAHLRQRPEFTGAVADGGAIARAEGGTYIR